MTPDEHDTLDVDADASEPFKRVVVCCTRIPHEHRTELANKVAELGGVHKYDLTPQVTHLIVGDYDTPKYRHVAKERPDVKPMDAHWVDAVNELWKNDDPLDLAALETAHRLRPLETCGIEAPSQQDSSSAARGSLLICLTGFGDQREDIANAIRAAGGRHTGDLTKRCTHLIAQKPEGKKFTAARLWGLRTVTLDWLTQSIQRGMILDEARFDPLLPIDEQGVGAWTTKSLSQSTRGKRTRSASTGNNDDDDDDDDGSGHGNDGGTAKSKSRTQSKSIVEDGPRKLRKTASKKLSSQTSHIWGDILGRPGSAADHTAPSKDDSHPLSGHHASPEPPTQTQTQPNHPPIDTDKGIFSDCIFSVHGFPPQRAAILERTIIAMGGSIGSLSADSHPSRPTTPTDHRNPGDPLEPPEPPEPSEYKPQPEHHRFLIVPQLSHRDTHPRPLLDGKVRVMTEFYIESCLHHKRFLPPDEHVLGRPFPRFPIPSFSDLTICTAAFTGIQLNHVSRSVAQLGATYEENFRRTASVLVCNALPSVRKEKLKLALDWGVPVVPADWLWQCISSGSLALIDDFIYPELKARYAHRSQHASAGSKSAEPGTRDKGHSRRSSSISNRGSSESKPPAAAGVDTTAFQRDPGPGPGPGPGTSSLSSLSSTRSSSRTRNSTLVKKGHPATADDFASTRTSTRSHSTSSSRRPPPPIDGSINETTTSFLAEVSSATLNKSSSAGPKPLLAIRPHHRSPFAPSSESESESESNDESDPERTPQPPSPGLQKTTLNAPANTAPTQDKNHAAAALPCDQDAAAAAAAAAQRRAANDQEADRRHRQGLTTALSDLMTTPDTQIPLPPPAPRPRRQKITGRATSNVSAASSVASFDGNGNGNGNGHGHGHGHGANGLDGLGLGDEMAGEARPPPATQLGYEDAVARGHREKLMSKMAAGAEAAREQGLESG